MSRLFRNGVGNKLTIGIAPDRLSVAAQAGGFGRGSPTAAGKAGTLKVEIARDLSDWRPAVEALPAAIALSGLHKPEVTVVVSSHFVRYVLLPANEALTKDEEWLSLARHRLAAIHGPAAAEWRVRVSAADAGVRVASAADPALIEEMRARMDDTGAALVSVQPNLMASFNALRKDLGEEACWLVIRSLASLTMALLEQGTWRAIRTRRIEDQWKTPIPEILERESALLALPAPYARSVLYQQEDFVIDGREPLYVPDWTLSGADDFPFEGSGDRRSKAPARAPQAAEH